MRETRRDRSTWPRRCRRRTASGPPAPACAAEETFPADWVVECTERSLANLGLETIDVQQFHVWSDEWVGQGDWLEAVEQLKRDGKIRFFGVSINDHQPANALRLVETGVVDIVQVIYNVFDQSPEDELFPAVEEADVGVIVRVPFDEGSLTGNVRPDTDVPGGRLPQRATSAATAGSEVWDRVQAIAADLGVPVDELAEIALRFCLAHPATSTVDRRHALGAERRGATPPRSTPARSTAETLDAPAPAPLAAQLLRLIQSRRSEPCGVSVLARVGAADEDVARDEHRLARAEPADVRVAERLVAEPLQVGLVFPEPLLEPDQLSVDSEPRPVERGLRIEGVVDEPGDELHVRLRLDVAADDPERAEQAAVPEEHPRDDRVVGPPAGLDGAAERKARAAVLEDDARPRGDERPSRRERTGSG